MRSSQRGCTDPVTGLQKLSNFGRSDWPSSAFALMREIRLAIVCVRLDARNFPRRYHILVSCFVVEFGSWRSRPRAMSAWPSPWCARPAPARPWGQAWRSVSTLRSPARRAHAPRQLPRLGRGCVDALSQKGAGCWAAAAHARAGAGRPRACPQTVASGAVGGPVRPLVPPRHAPAGCSAGRA